MYKGLKNEIFFTYKDPDMIKCPVCHKEEIWSGRFMCDSCRQQYEANEKHLDSGDWLRYNVWSNRLRFVPFGRKFVEKSKIYKLDNEEFVITGFLGIAGFFIICLIILGILKLF